jgi:protein ImuA
MRIAPALPRLIAAPEPLRRWPSGVATLDAALGGGFAYGRLHEIHAGEVGDAGAAAGFAAAIGTGMAVGGGTGSGGSGGQRPILWLRTRAAAAKAGVLSAQGWAELGGRPDQALISILADDCALLQAAVDALRSRAVGAVLVESWGVMRAWDLTTSRRLALAAERTGVPLLLLFSDAAPVPSAVQTRWQVAAAPSQALAAAAPGLPRFDVALLRQRSGPSGLDWRLEWNRDQLAFCDAAHAGAVVPVSARRPATDQRRGAVSATGRRAA